MLSAVSVMCDFCKLRIGDIHTRGMDVCRSCYLLGERSARLLGHLMHPNTRVRAAKRLEDLRLAAGLTYRGLAEKAQVSPTAVVSLMDPKTLRWPRLDTAVRICVALGVSLDEVLEWPRTKGEVDGVTKPAAELTVEDVDLLREKKLAAMRDGGL